MFGQNQQMGIGNNPFQGLSQPSYAPPRVGFGGQQQPMAPGPYMFRQALARVRITHSLNNYHMNITM
jgi:hypothetical protein